MQSEVEHYRMDGFCSALSEATTANIFSIDFFPHPMVAVLRKKSYSSCACVDFVVDIYCIVFVSYRITRVLRTGIYCIVFLFGRCDHQKKSREYPLSGVLEKPMYE